MSKIEDELIKSAKRDRWGFSQTLPATAQSQSLLQVELPIWAARVWTVTLLKQRYQGGGPLVPASVTAGDPDSQSMQQVQLRIEWGVGGAHERAVIDYPMAGASFQIHAAVLKLTVEQVFGGTTFQTLAGGFVSPNERGSNAQDIYPSATFTAAAFVAAAGGQAFFSRPSRAVAYRISTADAVNANRNIDVLQLSVGGSVNGVDYAGAAAATGEPLTVFDSATTKHLYPTRSAWIPLSAFTNGIQVTNRDATNIQPVFVQWLLDLG